MHERYMAPLDLCRLLHSAHTAILTSEGQQGIIGEGSKIGALVEAE